MSYAAPSKEAAERAIAKLAPRIGGRAAAGADRTVTRHILERYPNPDGQFKHNDFCFDWGVVERWTYNDRPDLGEFGGAFYNLTPDLWA